MEIVPVNGYPKGRNRGPSCMTRTIRNGAKLRDLDMKSLTVPHLQPTECPPATCAKCLGRKTKNIQCQYIQPARPKNFAPEWTYNPPVQRMENHTIYKGSYVPTEGDRPDAVLPRHNLRMPTSKFASNTIQKMSFPGWYNQERTEPILPCNHEIGGRGVISEDTTQRLDYIEKNIDPPDPILPRHNLFRSEEPFSKLTVNQLSYQPNNATEMREPFVQTGTMVWPTGPLETNTIQKMSFQPCKIPKKEFYPWAQIKQYVTPTTKMVEDTIYKKSYVPSDKYARIDPIIPVPQKRLLAEHDGFDSNTIYHMSYPRNDGFHRPDEVRPRHNIFLNREKMQSNTTQKLSYIPNLGHSPPDPILPCNHEMGGRGPMEDTTTTQCDYFEKDINVVSEIRPRPHLFLSCQPMSDKTVNRLSFMPPNPKEQATLIIPPNQFTPPTGKMDGKTTQKMSYTPVGPVEPVPMPWAIRKPYCTPKHKFVEDTCYRMSYDVPGEWVNCEGGNGDDGPCECECKPNDCPCACPCPPVPVC